MASKVFVIKHGILCGPFEVDAVTGNVVTTGNLNAATSVIIEPDVFTYKGENVLVDAPSDGSEYVRKDALWSVSTGGGGEDEVAQAKMVDFIDDDHIYIGEAVPGTLESVAAWRLKYVTIATDGDVATKWASGNATYDKIWNNRLGYTYT